MMESNQEINEKLKTITDDDFNRIEHLVKSPTIDFNIDAFSKPIVDYILHRESVLNEKRDFLILAAHSAVASAIGGWTESKFKHPNKPILWSAIVAPTGSGKSTPIKGMLKPQHNKHHKSAEDYLHEKELVEDFNKRAKKKDQKPLPVFVPFVVSDTTYEGLIVAHKNNPKGIIIHVDELLGLVKSFGAYKGGKGGDQQGFLSMHDGSEIFKTRVTSDPISLPETCVNIIGGFQPSVIGDFFKDARLEDGFVFRFLFVFNPDYTPPPISIGDLDDKIQEEYVKTINQLIDNNSRSTINFSKEAQELFQYWKYRCEHYYQDNELERSYQAKLNKLVHRFALIYYVLNKTPFDQTISKEIMYYAIQNIEFFRRHFSNMMSYVKKGHFEKLPKSKQDLFNALPAVFQRHDGLSIALKMGMPERTFGDFINDKKLFIKVAHGKYKKINNDA